MHGNVGEWCQDWSGEYPDAAQTDPIGPREGSLRVYRGLGFYSEAWVTRSALGGASTPNAGLSHNGARLVTTQWHMARPSAASSELDRSSCTVHGPSPGSRSALHRPTLQSHRAPTSRKRRRPRARSGVPDASAGRPWPVPRCPPCRLPGPTACSPRGLAWGLPRMVGGGQPIGIRDRRRLRCQLVSAWRVRHDSARSARRGPDHADASVCDPSA